MKKGEESPAAWREIDELYRLFQSYSPKSDPAVVFYGEAVGKLNELVGARRDRLNASQDELPAEFLILIVGGALMLIFFLYIVGHQGVARRCIGMADPRHEAASVSQSYKGRPIRDSNTPVNPGFMSTAVSPGYARRELR